MTDGISSGFAVQAFPWPVSRNFRVASVSTVNRRLTAPYENVSKRLNYSFHPIACSRNSSLSIRTVEFFSILCFAARQMWKPLAIVMAIFIGLTRKNSGRCNFRKRTRKSFDGWSAGEHALFALGGTSADDSCSGG